ncbi:MAG: hypothetical protein KDA25_05145 [Phycisphaerales bacterium]|nr:hypothetical protein [Phycisphaerales bacterium]
MMGSLWTRLTVAAGLMVTLPCAAGLVDTFTIDLEELVSVDQPGPGAGTIEVSGASDVYTFDAVAGQRLYFDSVASSTCNLRWRAAAPSGALLFDNLTLCTDGGAFELTESGTYTVTGYGSASTTGTYSFIVWEVNDRDVFAIELEETVGIDQPGPGAGTIEEAGATDVYTFDAVAGDRLYFDSVASSTCNLRWRAAAPSGAFLFNNLTMCIDGGAFDLTESGTYTVTAYASASATGTYSFVVWLVNDPEVFAIELEEAVEPDQPGIGAGWIDEPGATDVYTFSAKAGGRVYFDSTSASTCNLRWRAASPSGALLFNDLTLCFDGGAFDLTESGTYTLTASGNASSTGTYSLIVWLVNDPDVFEIELDEIVDVDMPGPGAGWIEEAAAIDVYTFEATAGQRIYFDSIAASTCNLRWRAEAPSGAVLFNDLTACVDAGEFDLTESGTYTVTASGSTSSTGTYSFVVSRIFEPDEFTIALEDVVDVDQPGPGAGTIEEAGAVDVYSFDATTGQRLYFQSLAASTCNLRWRVAAPSGAVLFNDLSLCTDGGEVELTESGTYVVTASGIASATGTYSFIIWDVNRRDVFAIALGDVVEEGVPGPGAGAIEEPATVDIYTIDLDEDVDICVRLLDATTCNLAWRLVAPDRSEVFVESVCNGSGSYVLGAGGTYTLTVRGNGAATGTYSFFIVEDRISDLNDDCVVGPADLAILLGAWGENPGHPADLDGDGAVGPGDLAVLLSQWG